MSSSWPSYLDTQLRFPDADLTIDLRRPVSAPARTTLQALGLAGPFAIVTACNPRGRLLDAAANRRLALLLDLAVRDRFPGARSAHGLSPDGRHAEPGWALPAPRAEAARLAAQFFQEAMFWYEDGAFWIVPVLGRDREVRLPAPRDQGRETGSG